MAHTDRALTGHQPDIAAMLSFVIYELVYYVMDEADFPLDYNEKKGRFTTIAENVGNALCYEIVNDDTNKIIYQSTVCPITEDTINHCLQSLEGESMPPSQKIVCSSRE